MIFLPSSINKPFIVILDSPGPESTSIDDLEGISIKNHVGKGITTMLSETNLKSSPFFTIRRKMLIMSSIEDRLIEGV